MTGKRVFLCPHLEQSGKVWSPSINGQGCWLLALPQITLGEAERLQVVQVTTLRQISHNPTCLLVYFILEYVEVICRCHCNDVVLGMPSSVKDFLVEVQTIHADFILLAFPSSAHLAGL